MDRNKLILYLNILGICFPIASTYIIIVSIITSQTISPLSIVALAFGYVVMIRHNYLFRELWNKWFSK
jgi:hypothetical protein